MESGDSGESSSPYVALEGPSPFAGSNDGNDHASPQSHRERVPQHHDEIPVNLVHTCIDVAETTLPNETETPPLSSQTSAAPSIQLHVSPDNSNDNGSDHPMDPPYQAFSPTAERDPPPPSETNSSRNGSSTSSTSVSSLPLLESSEVSLEESRLTARTVTRRFRERLDDFHRTLNRTRSTMEGADRLPGRSLLSTFWATYCPKRIILPRKIRDPQNQKMAGLLALTAFVAVGFLTPYSNDMPKVRLAMIGNSMMYYNDFPRFLESISDHTIEQDSCLHGDATLHSILITGAGTYKIWRTGMAQIANASALLYDQIVEDDYLTDKQKYDSTRIYDYGACTVPQLLFGYDRNLDQKMEGWAFGNQAGDDYFEDDDYYTLDNDDKILAYDFESFFDGANPCLMDPNYYPYRNYLYWGNDQEDFDRHKLYPTSPKWDYIILNDNTRSPATYSSRQDSLTILEQQYLLWFQETAATPILMVTYAYDSPYRDMAGMVDIPTFTSLTYEGYRQYAELLSNRLPPEQQPKIAPVGLAFLTIWEEAYEFWNTKLFHVDRIHSSPHGTYLQGCVVYCTIYGRLPPLRTALDQLETLWKNARRMAPLKHRRRPLPTPEEATYLYHIAGRVCLLGHVPKSFIHYKNGEASTYIPTDDIYRNDDFY